MRIGWMPEYIKERIKNRCTEEKKNQIRQVYIQGDGVEQYAKIKYRQFILVICIVFFTSLLAICFVILQNNQSIIQNGKIKKPGYGQADQKAELNVSFSDGKDGFEENMALTIPARLYTKEKKEKILEESMEKIESCFLGENESMKKISKPLILIRTVDNYPFEVKWDWDGERINADGSLNQTGQKSAEKVCITASIEWEEVKKEKTFILTIIQPDTTDKEKGVSILKEKIKKMLEDSAEDEYITLPQNAGNYIVSYEEKKKRNKIAGVFLLGILFSVIVYGKPEKDLNRKCENRKVQLQMDYPEMLGEFTLLLSAGLTVQMVLKKMTEEYEVKKEISAPRYVYEEVERTVHEIENGMSEIKAIENFGKRCGLLSYMKFSSLVSQNMRKGSAHLLDLLEKEKTDAYETMRENIKEMGEKASTKLLLPMMLMLFLVFTIILVPAFMSF